MPLSIKNDEADRLVMELVALTGESTTDAVVISLRERLDRKRAAQDLRPLSERLAELAREWNKRPVLDSRSADEIIGYDEHGLPR